MALIAFLFCGCRLVQRCRTTSDEAVAETRQLSLRGKDAQERGQWEDAEALYAAAIEKSPRDERARCGYAEALWQRGAQDDAVAHMEEAVRLSGHDPERLVQLGNMYLARGESRRAAEQAAKAIAANRELAGAWALQGHVLAAEGNSDQALAAFHRALSYQDQYPEVQLALAEQYRKLGRPQRALTTLQALSDAYPAGQVPPTVLIEQGYALRQLGRMPDAARSLAQAAERTNPSAELLCELARTQALAGDSSGARLSLAAALDRDPRHAASLALHEELATGHAVMASVAPR